MVVQPSTMAGVPEDSEFGLVRLVWTMLRGLIFSISQRWSRAVCSFNWIRATLAFYSFYETAREEKGNRRTEKSPSLEHPSTKPFISSWIHTQCVFDLESYLRVLRYLVFKDRVGLFNVEQYPWSYFSNMETDWTSASTMFVQSDKLERLLPSCDFKCTVGLYALDVWVCSFGISMVDTRWTNNRAESNQVENNSANWERLAESWWGLTRAKKAEEEFGGDSCNGGGGEPYLIWEELEGGCWALADRYYFVVSSRAFLFACQRHVLLHTGLACPSHSLRVGKTEQLLLTLWEFGIKFVQWPSEEEERKRGEREKEDQGVSRYTLTQEEKTVQDMVWSQNTPRADYLQANSADYEWLSSPKGNSEPVDGRIVSTIEIALRKCLKTKSPLTTQC